VYPSTTGASQVVVTPGRGPLSRQVEARLTRDLWDMSTTGFGIAVGGAVGHLPGVVVGGAVGYGVGRWRWHMINKKP